MCCMEKGLNVWTIREQAFSPANWALRLRFPEQACYNFWFYDTNFKICSIVFSDER